METEIWESVVGYEGYYEVSSLGRLKSIMHGAGRRIGVLKPSISSSGYYTCVLYKDFKKRTISMHTIIAMAFLGHRREGHKFEIDHIDGDKKNNRVDNLRILTTRENTTEYQKRNKSKSSKYIGVSKDPESDCWKAIIYTEKRNKYIGRFKTEIEASEAYQKELSIISTG